MFGLFDTSLCADASNAPHSFLLTLVLKIALMVGCVNALKRAALISTGKSLHVYTDIDHVSMPSNGPHSFPRRKEKCEKKCVKFVSMPSNGPHSFPHHYNCCGGINYNVSMPSNGPHSFLQWRDLKQHSIGRCQCPQTGHTHFYKLKKLNRIEKNNVCQCPQTGHTHFYRVWSGCSV